MIKQGQTKLTRHNAALDALDLNRIPDEDARQAIRLLLNLAKEVRHENRNLREKSAFA